MATFRMFDAAGEGLLMAATGPLTGEYSGSSRFVSSTYLGNFTYLERYAMLDGPFTSYAGVIYNGIHDNFLQTVTYFVGTRKGMEITDINWTARQLTLGGLEGRLTGNDAIYGAKFSDRILGFGGNDILFGNGGDDTIRGYVGNDMIGGGIGVDLIWGGAGTDRIRGGAGNDIVSGGTGADAFLFASDDGRDTVSDFQNGVDRIVIQSGASGFNQVRVWDSGADAVVAFGNVTVRISNLDHRNIEASDFVFG